MAKHSIARRRGPLSALVVALLLIAGPARAATIDTTLLDLGGSVWEATFSITNDLAVDINQFTVYFDVASYRSLGLGPTPTDWDAIVLQPDPLLPDDGIYDALALTAGLAPGTSLGGFTVQFLFLGAGAPGPLQFDIVDPDTFDVLASGASVPTVVPLPAAAWLLVSGCWLLTFSRRRLLRATTVQR